MTNEENKKGLTDLENQKIDGTTVLGGGTDMGLTQDFSAEAGMVSEGDAGIQNMEPVDQLAVISENPLGANTGNPPGPLGTGGNVPMGGPLPIDNI